jgi:hypothetical protein
MRANRHWSNFALLVPIFSDRQKIIQRVSVRFGKNLSFAKLEYGRTQNLFFFKNQTDLSCRASFGYMRLAYRRAAACPLLWQQTRTQHHCQVTATTTKLLVLRRLVASATVAGQTSKKSWGASLVKLRDDLKARHPHLENAFRDGPADERVLPLVGSPRRRPTQNHHHHQAFV